MLRSTGLVGMAVPGYGEANRAFLMQGVVCPLVVSGEIRDHNQPTSVR